MVPVHKTVKPKQPRKKHVCGDFLVTVNSQLEPHRHPTLTPKSLMHKFADGYGFTKIDLADVYNQIPVSPVSQRKLALCTQRCTTSNDIVVWYNFSSWLFSRTYE